MATPLSLLAIALCVIGGLALSWDRLDQDPGADVWADLQAALEFRLTESRLAGVSLYKPYRQFPPSPELTRSLAPIVREIGRRLEGNAALQGPDYAVFDLLRGDADAAVDRLEHALEKRSGDADLLTDLAAAYLARSVAEKRPLDVVRALSSAQKAVSASPENVAAHFNRALALERLHLDQEAREAWLAYLDLERDPSWREEAREHRRQLEEPKQKPELQLAEVLSSGGEQGVSRYVSSAPEEAREYAEHPLLSSWATDVISGDRAAAGRNLTAARKIGNALALQSSDFLIGDFIAAADRSERDSAELAQAYSLFLEGRKAYDGFDIVKARERLNDALSILPASGKPLRFWIETALAGCDYQESSYEPAVGRLESLLANSQVRRYPALEERLLWLRGLIAMVQANPSLALSLYGKALSSSEKRGEIGRSAVFNFLISEVFQVLGNAEQTWSYLDRALSANRALRESRQRQAIFESAALAAMSLAEPSAATWFQNEAVRIARETSKPVLLAGALASRARMHLAAHVHEEAGKDLKEARRVSEEIKDQEVRKSVLADLFIVEGELLAETDPAGAISNLSNALAGFDATGYDLVKLKLYLERSKAFLRKGEDGAAESDILKGIAEVNRRRLQMDREVSVTDLLDGAELYSSLLEMKLRQKAGSADLFDLAEASKALVKPDLYPVSAAELEMADAGPRPLRLYEIQGRLPEDVVLIQYALLGERLLLLSVSRRNLSFHQVDFDSVKLQRCIDQIMKGMVTGAKRGMLSPCLKGLYTVLVAPISKDLHPGQTLVFLPDGTLSRIPFAALITPGDVFLIEEHPVAVAPTATLFVRGLERSRSLAAQGSGKRAVLAVGNPWPGHYKGIDLADLPQAAEEAAAVAKLYERHLIRLGEAATKEDFLRNVGGYPVIHLAGHAVGSSVYPFLSHFVFASETSAPAGGGLYAYEIYSLQIDQAQLIFLSGCEGAAERSLPGVGIIGMVRPFLGIGVPGVVASLARIEDGATKRFALEFHRRYAQGQGALASFQEAQLSVMQRRDDGDWTWALFQFFGADFSSGGEAGI